MSERHNNGSQLRNERGVSLITVMMVILIMTLMGISILSVTGFERQISSAVSANEASASAAESCVSTGANVIQQFVEASGVMPPTLVAPGGPVPVTNVAALSLELGGDGGNPDVPVTVGPLIGVPNLVMQIGNDQVFGDIDRLYKAPQLGGDPTATPPVVDYFYRITCVAVNPTTGTTSQVGALFVCNSLGWYCQQRIAVLKY